VQSIIKAAEALIIDTLYRETTTALKSDAVTDRLAKLEAEPMFATPEEFDTLVKTQIAENAALAQAAGISGN
jgi:tripartite-type tricarboxylate transporter receptor subunit TctC